MRKNGLVIKKFFFLLLFSLNVFVFSMNPIIPVLAGDIDEVDGFQTAPHWRWRNITETSSTVDEYMEGDFLFVNNTNISGYSSNYTKARRLNDRDMYFDSRFLLDVGGQFNGSEYWLEYEGDLVDYNEGDLDTYSGTEFTHSYDYYDGAGVIETASTPIDLNLTALYHLDEGTGTNAIDLSNSTNQHNGSISSVSWAVPALFGNGSLANDFPSPDNWYITDHADFNFQNKSFTLELWFNKTDDADGGGLIVKAGPVNREWEVSVTSGEAIRFRIYDSDNDYIGRSTGSGNISINSYSHIAVVYEGGMTNSNCSIYINGTKKDVSDFSSGTFNGMPDTSERIYVGGEFQSPSGFSVGIIDEVRIWRSSLNQSELTDSYNGAPSVLPSRATYTLKDEYEIETSVEVPSLPDELNRIYKYLEMEFYFESEDNGNITGLQIYDSTDPSVYYNDSTLRTNGTNEVFQVNLAETSDWELAYVNNRIGIRFNTTLDPITIAINYTFVGNFPYYSDNNTIGDYNAEEGFKFFLMNEENQTSMEWEFTHDSTLNSSANYSLRINIYNASGYPVLTSNETFEYHYTTHGWLDLEVEWNIDTKRVRVRLTDGLRNRIVDYKDMGDIFPVSQLITEFNYAWSLGKPLLGFNCTTPELARVWVVLDYIDSNYDLMDWYEVGEAEKDILGGDVSAPDSDYTSANQWSVISLGKQHSGSIEENSKRYYHDIDHFDSISFDFELNISGLEVNDEAVFDLYVYNVMHNGTLLDTLRIRILHEGGVGGYGKPKFDMWILSEDYPGSTQIFDFDFTYDWSSVNMAFELFYDDEQALIYQSNVESREESFFSSAKLIPYDPNQPFTKEFVIYFGYYIYTDNGNYVDDDVYFNVREYDVIRKGLLGDIVTGFLGAIIGFFQMLFAPILIGLMFLGGIFVRAIQTLGKFLEPLFGLITAAIDGLGEFFTALGEAILEIANLVGTWIADNLGDLISSAIEFLGTILTELVGFGADLLFYIWDDWIGGPDLLAIFEIFFLDFLFPILAGIPGFLIDLIAILFAIGNLMLLGFWVYAIFLGFASQKFDPFAGISEFIERMLKGPDVTVLGVGPARVPIGLFVVLPLSLFIILLPTGSMLIFW